VFEASQRAMSALPSPSKSKSTALDNCPNIRFVEAVLKALFEAEVIDLEDLIASFLLIDESLLLEIARKFLLKAETIFSLMVGWLAISKPSGQFRTCKIFLYGSD
jgi:hypothetical protein